MTVKAGLDSSRLGKGLQSATTMAMAIPDIYLTCYGTNILYRNNRDGTFTDVTGRPGVGGSGWSTSAVWFDYDNDGKLDLFVCSFVDYSARSDSGPAVREPAGGLYCIPKPFRGSPPVSCTTTTATVRSPRLASSPPSGRNLGKAHGVVATDVNGDGLLDLWVSNDTVAELPVPEPRRRQVRGAGASGRCCIWR